MLTTEIRPSALLLIIGSAQAFFLSLLVFLQTRLPRAHNQRQMLGLLAALLFVLGVVILEQFLDTTRYFIYAPHLIYTSLPLVLLIGPLLFGLVWAELHPKTFVLGRRHLWHLLPMVLYVIAFVPLLMVFSAETKLASYYQNVDISLPDGTPFWYFIGIINLLIQAIHLLELSTVGYTLAGFVVVYQHRDKVGDRAQTTFGIRAGWLILALSVLLAMAMFSALAGVLIEAFGVPEPLIFNGMLTVTSLVIFAGVLIPIQLVQQRKEPEKVAAPSPKYQNSTLCSAQLEAIANKLTCLMTHEHLYLDENLNLPLLAVQAEQSTNHVSQAINAVFGVSYSEFVNCYRVEAAQALLRDPNNDDLILTIALAVGFNSKATFYAAFKKQVGMTPSAYKKRLQNRDVATADAGALE